MYPRNRTADMEKRDHLSGSTRASRHLAARARKQRVLRVVERVGRWLRCLWGVWWWMILIYALVVLYILFACFQPGARTQMQVRQVQWRAAFDGNGVHQLPGHDLPALAWTPPGEATGQAALDAWLAERRLRR